MSLALKFSRYYFFGYIIEYKTTERPYMRPLRSFYAFFNVTPRIRLRQQITSIGRMRRCLIVFVIVIR